MSLSTKKLIKLPECTQQVTFIKRSKSLNDLIESAFISPCEK